MKRTMIAVLLFGIVLPTLAQAPGTKYVILSPKSNLDTASISEGFSKYCPNVVITENEAKADYVLEASSKMTLYDGDSYTTWHFTLLNKDGDVLMTTRPERHFANKYKHHSESVCKYIKGK